MTNTISDKDLIRLEQTAEVLTQFARVVEVHKGTVNLYHDQMRALWRVSLHRKGQDPVTAVGHELPAAFAALLRKV